MQPLLQQLDAFRVAGLTVRTTNREESDPQAARIGNLWGRFFENRIYEKVPHRTADARLYGVYSDYESDAHGAFNHTTGVAVSEDASTVRIEAGNYLVFTGQGEMPQMVISVWESIWQYFEQHPEVRRSYCSDFEAYDGPDQVAIHIGVTAT
ncbi:MAG: GyrI-like domain-containing protein [Variovorax sp.]